MLFVDVDNDVADDRDDTILGDILRGKEGIVQCVCFCGYGQCVCLTHKQSHINLLLGAQDIVLAAVV